MKPLKIAIIDYVLEPDKPGRNGLSDLVWDMASELVNQGHEPHIIASYHSDCYPDERVTVHNFQTPPIGYRNVLGHFWILKRATDIIRKLNPDLIHSPEYISTAVLAILRIKTPIVLTVPGSIYQKIHDDHGYEWYYAQILKLAARISARRCDRIIATSVDMKQWWEWTGSKPEKTPYIPLGVNTKRFYYHKDARETLGIDKDTILLLYAGRFSKEKGLLDLVEALIKCKSYFSQRDIRVVLIGKGPQLKEIEQRINKNNVNSILHIKKWVDKEEMPIWYSAADAFLLPSYSESISRTIPEAMMCGTPVIGTKITGSVDHIRDGENGFLFEKHNPESLGMIFQRIINNEINLNSMRQTTLTYAQENFPYSHIISRIVNEVYFPIIKDNDDGINQSI
jgi:glycosyltransferase involved in cell wall biosynthesis